MPLSRALRLLILMTILTGGVYPLAMRGIELLAFERDADAVRVGRAFEGDRYFHGRPSPASNLGPGNPELLSAIRSRAAGARGVPGDLVTASGSGLDPHLRPASALFQVPRVAHARGLPEEEVRRLVLDRVEGRTWGLLGEPRVDVARLNADLDALSRSREGR